MFQVKDLKFLLFLLSVLTVAYGAFIVKDICGPNEEYLLCGSSCPFNCSNPEGPVECMDDCVEGCFCKAGFLRNDNGTCVPPNQCAVGNKTSICEDNEEFLACGTACPLTCSQPEQPTVCGFACSMGCFCKSGYVRDESTNTCVRPNQCPFEQCFNENEVYDACNAACEPSCADPLPICAKLCSGGCVCAPGYLRDDQGVCVTVNNCPITNGTDPGLVQKYLNAINKILHLTSEA